MLEENYQIWNREILTAVCFSEFEEEPEALTPEFRSAIQDKIDFINRHHQEILNSASGMAELAEDWLIQGIEDDTVDLDELTSVTMEDGTEVAFPVTEKAFKNSLYLIDVTFEFRKNSEICKAFLEFGCEPDYFCGHRVHIKINEEHQIICEGI
ncbi:MAG: DUF2262 domain-containing protein [Ruminococcus sp.]|nr:DUF2262 domain-containing protein [Ruminococcus sp.]